MLAESISRIRNHDCDAGIHLDLPQNRVAGFRYGDDSISAGQTLPRTQIVEGLLHRLPESRNFLRERGESNLARHRESLPTYSHQSDGRIQYARRNAFRYRGGVSFDFHSFFKSLISLSS